MNERTVVEQKKTHPSIPPRGDRAEKSGGRYAPEFRLKAVRLHLEEGFSQSTVCTELKLGHTTLCNWVKRYHEFGEAGLQPAPQNARPPQLPPAIREQILALKQEHPGFGIQRISQWLRRWFLLPASPETVRRQLHAAGLMAAAPPPKKRNITRPRFFERATPNQMWQSDIFTFRLGGRYAYLIAFLDDYSRFVVGADLFRSPTAAAVIEVYRVAIGEYQPPKEMLTDNGRQYTSWRGTSRFEAELKKDRVAHFKSRPHHPMTLGKIERFWSTIWQDFLVRAQFDSFEAARERIKLWIQYYNHKRPHQGIEGLCPADRFFEIQSQLRQTLEAGMQENLLELALRGKPQAPFYMVGRMDGQSVVLRAEKGKLKLSVSDQNNQQAQELTYDLTQQNPDGTNEALAPTATPGAGQGPGGAGGVDGTVQAGGGLPPVEHQLGHLQPVAAAGDGRDAAGAGVAGEPQPGRGVESAPADVAPEPPAVAYGHAPDGAPAPDQQGCQDAPTCGTTRVDEPQSPTPGGADLAGPLGPEDGHACGAGPGHLPPAVLRVGTTSLAGAAHGLGGPAHGAPQVTDGPGEGKTPTPGATTGATGAAV
jgi:transposase InsO family protein